MRVAAGAFLLVAIVVLPRIGSMGRGAGPKCAVIFVNCGPARPLMPARRNAR
jgi:hypothetical protein